MSSPKNIAPKISGPGVYVISYAEIPMFYKIGYSVNAVNRISQLGSGIPFEPILTWFIACPAGRTAKFVERVIHNRLAAYRHKKNNEWFRLFDVQVDDLRRLPRVDVDITEPEYLEKIRQLVDQALGTADIPFTLKTYPLFNDFEVRNLAVLSERAKNVTPPLTEWMHPDDKTNSLSWYILDDFAQFGLVEAQKIIKAQLDDDHGYLYRITPKGEAYLMRYLEGHKRRAR